MKKLALVLIAVMMMSLMAPALAEDAHLTVAYQYGLAYAPVVMAMTENFIQDAYAEATGNTLEVEWVQMSSGADINTGVMSGTVDVGFMGVGPAITGISKNVGYKIFTNLSGQEHGMMTSEMEIKELGDIVGSDRQIALVNIGSIQHIILARALAQNGFDAHALDANLVAMKHPDGMNALMTGAVSLHLTTNPYIYRERETDGFYEVNAIADSWPKENSFIVGVAAIDLHDNRPELYKALCDGMTQAIEYVNSNLEATADLTCQYDGNSPEDELRYLQMGSYSPETRGVADMAAFMYENAFIEADPGDYANLVFDNVTGD